jgi:hypothetical protein
MNTVTQDKNHGKILAKAPESLHYFMHTSIFGFSMDLV